MMVRAGMDGNCVSIHGRANGIRHRTILHLPFHLRAAPHHRQAHSLSYPQGSCLLQDITPEASLASTGTLSPCAPQESQEVQEKASQHCS
jgi:hypothetical protein